MNVRLWKLKNNVRRLGQRLRYPPPMYKRVGGVEVTVNRANGKVENLGVASDTYAKRWGVGSSQG